MPDAALYQRVSDGTDRSVEQQNDDNVRAAEHHGWSYKSFSDPVSASRFSKKPRPGWDALVADLARGRYRYVVLWEPSRGDRRLSRWAAFLDACREHQVGIYVTSQSRLYEPWKPRDWRTLAEDGVDSAYEVEKTSERSRRGVAGAAAGGEPYGRVPYGYRREYERVDGRARPRPSQVPDEQEAPIAAEIITRIAAGDAVSAILRDFASRGVVTRAGKPWARASVCRLVLGGVVYIGKRRHNGGPLLDGSWPAIVDEDVYWAAVAVLRDPARKTAATRGGGGIRPGKARWLLSYVARCGKCDAKLHVHTHNRPEPYYRCGSSGGHAYAPVAWMDHLVTEAVIAWCARPGVYEAIVGGDERAAASRDEAKAERDRLDGFRQQAIAGRISAESFAVIAAGIEQRIADLEDEASTASVLPSLRELTRSDREEDIRERWTGMPLGAQRSVLQKISAVRLLPVGEAPHGTGLLNPWRVEMGFRDQQ